MFDGPQSLEDFKRNGEEFFQIYTGICGLQPTERILDVGSGIGRKTLPLTGYLTSGAVYEGIDVTKKGIDWCETTISPLFPNFRFHHINVYNKHYNPHGHLRSSEYVFPFESGYFDFVMLGSVFTHMPTEDAKNYLCEVHRVMRDGGRCLITYFLLNDESLDAIREKRSTLDFKHSFGNYLAVSREIPELAMAYDENWVHDAYRHTGLAITRVDYGYWYGRLGAVSYQDLVLAVKRDSRP
jgi:SAM-dependent methyltransferase